jgi:hypothetical protein
VPSRPPRLVRRQISHDPRKPRTETIGIVKLAKALPDADERFLDDIAGSRGVADDSIGDRQRSPLMPAEKLGKRRLVPSSSFRDQFPRRIVQTDLRTVLTSV